MLSRYRVEDDPDWAAWRSVRAAEVLANLSSLHARLLATLKASEGGREKPLMTKNQMLIRLSQSENTKFGRRILLGNPFPKKSSPQFAWRFEARFTPCVEIGWRLAAECWGRGLATEGASAVADYAFKNLSLDEIIATTVPANTRSRRVMEKLAMTHNPANDFDHPLLPEGHRLRRHMLYRLRRTGSLKLNFSFPICQSSHIDFM